MLASIVRRVSSHAQEWTCGWEDGVLARPEIMFVWGEPEVGVGVPSDQDVTRPEESPVQSVGESEESEVEEVVRAVMDFWWPEICWVGDWDVGER